jgi:hypothetical protein
LDENENVTVFELKESYLYGKLMGFVPSIIRNNVSEGEDSALCLLSHTMTEDTMIFVLCRDVKIRIWSFVKKKILLTIDVGHIASNKRDFESSTSSTTNPTVRRPLLKKTFIDGHLYIVAYINAGDQKEFVAFRVSRNEGKIESKQVASICHGQNEDVIDFTMFRDELISLVLDSKSDFQVKSTSLQE